MIRTAHPAGVATPPAETSKLPAHIEQACDELQGAIDQGGIGDIVAKHEKLILHYYQDVQDQAKKSFSTARWVSLVGFAVLIGTVVHALWINPEASIEMTSVGLLSGTLIEFIAAVAFWLYARGARQFGAFHICLERTHRYLLAYKIAEQIGSERDATLQKLVCIMANAPMIAHVGNPAGTDLAQDRARSEAP